MKTYLPRLAAIFTSVLATTLTSQADILTYSFMDPSIQESDLASVFVGDITGGQVIIDTATGDYTVTWVASSLSHFMPPVQFILNLGNAGLGDVVSLSSAYHGISLLETFSYSGNEPALMAWVAEDLVVTSGNASEYSIDFDSGIFSLFPDMDPELGTDLLVHAGTFAIATAQPSGFGENFSVE